MTGPDPASARALAEEALALAQKATPGPWYAHNPDDWMAMNAFVVSTGQHEPDVGEWNGVDPKPYGWDEQICITLLQAPRVISGDTDWEENAALIAHAGTHYEAIARALLSALDRERAALDREARARALLVSVEERIRTKTPARLELPCCDGGSDPERVNARTGHHAECALAAFLAGPPPASAEGGA